jgi:hypothetical protein
MFHNPSFMLVLVSFLILLPAQQSLAMITCPPDLTLKENVLEKNEREKWCQSNKGERLGSYIRYFADGKTATEGSYLLNKKDGRWRSYFSNGQLKEENHWRNGRLNGSYQTFFENRQIEEQGRYQRNWKTGLWKHYLSDGSLGSSIDYGASHFQIYGHYYGVSGNSDISHFTALDMTARWPAVLVDRMLIETGLVIGWVGGKNDEYVVTIAPELRFLWCLGPWFRLGPLVGYEKWPRLTSRPSFGGRLSFILEGTQATELHHPRRSFTELVFTAKALSSEYQVLMAGLDLWGF